MTDLRNIIKISFPDDGVSVFYVICVIVHYLCYILIITLFLVDVGRPPSGHTSADYEYAFFAI